MILLRRQLSPLNISSNEENQIKEKQPIFKTLLSSNNKPIILSYSQSHQPQQSLGYFRGNFKKPIIFNSLSLHSSSKAISPLDVTASLIKIPETTKFSHQYHKSLKESKSLALYPHISSEFTVEEQMIRKNCFKIQKLNTYSRLPVEYSPDFYKEGELIPGSSNTLRKKNISLLKKSSLDTLNYKVKLLDSKKIWINKVKSDLLLKDRQYVLNLKP